MEVILKQVGISTFVQNNVHGMLIKIQETGFLIKNSLEIGTFKCKIHSKNLFERCFFDLF
jgi:hypothetical protein